MDRTWLETIQLLGLDVELAVIVMMLVGIGLADLARAALRRSRHGQDVGLGTRTAPTRPLDAWPSQGWGPSH
jgi:hypothetical protein